MDNLGKYLGTDIEEGLNLVQINNKIKREAKKQEKPEIKPKEKKKKIKVNNLSSVSFKKKDEDNDFI
jgi:ethanolamine utilization protein EutQ (cupin superfamily)